MKRLNFLDKILSLPEASVVEGVDRPRNKSPVMLLEVCHEIRPE